MKLKMIVLFVILLSNIVFAENAWKGKIVQINNKFYCQDENENMLTGWQYINNEWYYFDLETKQMTIGWKNIENNNMYFDENGRMVSNAVIIIDGKEYKFNENGMLLTSEDVFNTNSSKVTEGKAENSIVNENNDINIIGKTADECITESTLYKAMFSNQVFNDRYNIRNKKCYDETRIMIYYPIYSDESYCSFLVTTQEELTQDMTDTVVGIYFCRYAYVDNQWIDMSKEEGGKNGKVRDFYNSNEKDNYRTGLNNFKNDLKKLYLSGKNMDGYGENRAVMNPGWYFHEIILGAVDVQIHNDYDPITHGWYTISTDPDIYHTYTDDYNKQRQQIQSNFMANDIDAARWANQLNQIKQQASVKASINGISVQQALQSLGYYDILSQAMKNPLFKAYYAQFY